MLESGRFVGASGGTTAREAAFGASLQSEVSAPVGPDVGEGTGGVLLGDPCGEVDLEVARMGTASDVLGQFAAGTGTLPVDFAVSLVGSLSSSRANTSASSSDIPAIECRPRRRLSGIPLASLEVTHELMPRNREVKYPPHSTVMTVHSSAG